MLQPWRTAVVTRIEQQTPNTRRFFLKVPETDNFDFKPGQFVTLDLPIHEKPNKRWRSYSIASWPNGTNEFELCIVHLEEGAGTTYLFEEVKEGSELTFRGAAGVFTLHDGQLDNDLFLVCTGTGIAPFRSMMQYVKLHRLPHKNVYLLFGCRKQCDLLYGEEFVKLTNEEPDFHYIPTLSREDWGGAKGYVHAVYEAVLKEHPSPNATFMLCGWKDMIDEAKQRILAMGYDKKAIHSELYG